ALAVSAAAADVSRSYSVDRGPAAATYTAPTTEGSHTVVVTDLDTAGNTASASLTFTLDTTAPGAPAVALVSDTGSSGSDKITNNGALSVTGVESGASVQYSTNGGTTWSSSFTAVEGANAVQVRQVDVAGNPTATPTSFSFTLDTTIATPTVALTHDTGTSSSDKITNDASLTVSAAAADVTRTYKVDGGSASTSYTAP